MKLVLLVLGCLALLACENEDEAQNPTPDTSVVADIGPEISGEDSTLDTIDAADTVDATSDDDGDTYDPFDSRPILPPCHEIEAALAEFIQTNRSCEPGVDSCSAIGGGSCDCVIEAGAVVRSAATRGRELFEQAMNCGKYEPRWQHCGYDYTLNGATCASDGPLLHQPGGVRVLTSGQAEHWAQLRQVGGRALGGSRPRRVRVVALGPRRPTGRLAGRRRRRCGRPRRRLPRWARSRSVRIGGASRGGLVVQVVGRRLSPDDYSVGGELDAVDEEGVDLQVPARRRRPRGPRLRRGWPHAFPPCADRGPALRRPARAADGRWRHQWRRGRLRRRGACRGPPRTSRRRRSRR